MNDKQKQKSLERLLSVLTPREIRFFKKEFKKNSITLLEEKVFVINHFLNWKKKFQSVFFSLAVIFLGFIIFFKQLYELPLHLIWWLLGYFLLIFGLVQFQKEFYRPFPKNIFDELIPQEKEM